MEEVEQAVLEATGAVVDGVTAEGAMAEGAMVLVLVEEVVGAVEGVEKKVVHRKTQPPLDLVEGVEGVLESSEVVNGLNTSFPRRKFQRRRCPCNGPRRDRRTSTPVANRDDRGRPCTSAHNDRDKRVAESLLVASVWQ